MCKMKNFEHQYLLQCMLCHAPYLHTQHLPPSFPISPPSHFLFFHLFSSHPCPTFQGCYHVMVVGSCLLQLQLQVLKLLDSFRILSPILMLLYRVHTVFTFSCMWFLYIPWLISSSSLHLILTTLWSCTHTTVNCIPERYKY